MKNLITLFTVSVLFFSQLLCLAQSFEIVEGTKHSVVYALDEAVDKYEVMANVKNISSSTITVTNKYVSHSLAAGHGMQICWGENCLAQPDVEFNNVTLQPNQATYKAQGILLDLFPNGKTGKSSFVYRVLNIENPTTDFKDVEVTFDIRPTGVFKTVKDISNYSISTAYPNPASNQTSIKYSLPSASNNSSIKLYDLMGKQILNIQLEEKYGEVSLNVKNLAEGIYFYSLVVDGKSIITKKLVVSRS